MIVFPNCKINLGLKIINKREDGYHNIDTIFYPVGLKDILEVVEAEDGDFSFTSGGIHIEGDSGKNLCVKAYHLMKDKYNIPAVKIYLQKTIPYGSGLGGGSSDATFTIQLINEIFNLKLNSNDLLDMANQLGSDCAFFIHNKPVMACERGNVFKNIPLTLKGYYIWIIFPGIQISTAEAYSHVAFANSRNFYRNFNKMDISEWRRYLSNDFEAYAFNKYPVLNEIKGKLYSAGAEFALMSGSGSAIYGLFSKKPDLDQIRLDNYMWLGLLS